MISGFILALPFARSAIHQSPKVGLRKYFLRRLTRLEPPYILNLIVGFVFGALWLHSKHMSPWPLAPHLLASAAYLHNLVYGAKSAINPAAWSLEIEIQFYCLVPLLASVFLIKQRFVRRCILICAMLAAMLWQVWLPEFPETILGQVQFFLSGFLLADVYLCEWKEAPTSHWSWDLVSIALWPFVFLFSSRVGQWLFPFAVLALYCAAFRGKLFRRFVRHSWITTTGGMCYTIYLFHQLAILNAGYIVDRFHIGNNPHLYFVTEALFILPFVGVVSVVYFVLVERPCMNPTWPSKAWTRVVGGTRRLVWTGDAPTAKASECRRAVGD